MGMNRKHSYCETTKIKNGSNRSLGSIVPVWYSQVFWLTARVTEQPVWGQKCGGTFLQTVSGMNNIKPEASRQLEIVPVNKGESYHRYLLSTYSHGVSNIHIHFILILVLEQLCKVVILITLRLVTRPKIVAALCFERRFIWPQSLVWHGRSFYCSTNQSMSRADDCTCLLEGGGWGCGCGNTR